MTASTILILGSADDDHAVAILQMLRAAGHDAELLDSRWFPSEMTIVFEPSTGQGTIGLPEGRQIEFAAVRSVYWRSYNGVGTPELPDPEQAYIAHNDARGLFESLLIHLPARWVNGWDAYRLHQTKPVQLARVAALGVQIPRTFLGNDAHALLEFAKEEPRAIFKPIQGGAETRRLTPQHLTPENLESLRIAPVTLQAEVPGTNVRAFVFGDEVLACEVRTAQIDYREDQEPELLVHDLGPAMESLCRRIARELKLVWTGIDFRLTPAGEYVFLEANPSPMFLGFEAQTGLPLTERLVELLTAPHQRWSTP